MSKELIITLIKWGPLAFFGITFLIGFIVGIIKGRRKALKGLLYQTIFIVTFFFLTPIITKSILPISINGMSIQGYVNEFIENNETMKSLYEQVPALEEVIKTYPVAIVSLVLFLVIVIVGLPLSFPIYILYSIIFNLIAKHVFKYSKYEKDENGNIRRNEKGKKIKAKRKKHRLAGGAIKGIEGVLVSSIILMPIGVITRLYLDGKEASDKELSEIEYLQNYKDILDYIDAFNGSVVGKITNSGFSKATAGYLTTVEVNGEKSTLEKELSSIVVAAVYIENSGIIKLFSNGVDIKTLDLSVLNIDKLDKAIEILFNSSTLKALVADGINYVLNNNLKETLVEYTEDEDIVSKLKYTDSDEVKQDLLKVTSVIKDIINAKLLETYQKSDNNYIYMVNEIKTSDVESILNKVLSIKILSEAMPGVTTKLLKDRGLTEELTKDNNQEFVNLVVDLVKLVKSLEITSTSDLTDGNIMDNLVNTLYVEGAIKENSVDSLAQLLADLTGSKVFEGVLVKYLNDFLKDYEISLNAKMITRVSSKQEWKSELAVLDNIFKLYKDYQDNQTVDFLTANELITKLKETKAMILALPIAYQKVFPNLGIEVDLNKIKYIDYDSEDADNEEIRFYSYWREQLVHFEVISDELAKLKLESLDDVSLNLLENPNNVESLSKVVDEVFKTDLIRDGITSLINDRVKDLLVDYEVNLGDTVIDNVRKVVDEYPWYVVIDEVSYNVKKDDNDEYYLALGAGNDVKVSVSDNKVSYNDNEYEIKYNSSYLVWENELANLSNIVTVLKTGELTNKENLTLVLDSLDRMYLLKDAKVDLLVYAVKQLNILPEEDVNNLNKETINFTNEKEILVNVIGEYSTLQDVTGDGLSFETISDETITSLDNILGGDKGILKSDIFGDYVADKITAFAPDEYGITSEKVKESNTWSNDLTLMRDALKMDADSFNSTNLNSLFTKLEGSDLVKDQKESLLLTTARQVDLKGIEIPADLQASDIVYTDEKQALLTFADNKNLAESVSTLDLNEMDTDNLSNILADGIKSKMFGPSIVDNLTNVFVGENIKNDYDDPKLNVSNPDNFYLKGSFIDVGSRENWKNELDLVNNLMAVNEASDVNEDLFDSIEASRILGDCRAHILVKVLTTVNDSDNSLNLNIPTANNLALNLDDGQYQYVRYDNERAVIVAFANAGGSVPSINNVDDIKDNKTTLGNVLNAMKSSVVFSDKYNDVVSTIDEKLDNVANNPTITTWGLQKASNPNVKDWNKELDALITINDNVDSLTNVNATDYSDPATADATNAMIGSTLDSIDASDYFSGTDTIANNVVRQITGNPLATISKDEGKTWTETFENFTIPTP